MFSLDGGLLRLRLDMVKRVVHRHQTFNLAAIVDA